MRSRLKDLAERALVGFGIDAVARRWHRGRTVVLAYHNVVPDGEAPSGDGSLHLPQRRFASQLDILADTHLIVPLSSLVGDGRQEDGSALPPRAAITFDDAYRGALTAGLEELRRRDLPATFFVTPSLLEADAFWWDLLAADGTGAVDDGVREYALTELCGRQEDILRWARSDGLLGRDTVPEHARPASLDLVRSVAEDSHVTLASHGWEHLNLAAAPAAQISEELSKPVHWFTSHDLPHENWLAYPYGRHSEQSARLAERVYSLAFTTHPAFVTGRIEDTADRMRLPRVNVPAGANLNRFRLVASGAAGVSRT